MLTQKEVYKGSIAYSYEFHSFPQADPFFLTLAIYRLNIQSKLLTQTCSLLNGKNNSIHLT